MIPALLARLEARVPSVSGRIYGGGRVPRDVIRPYLVFVQVGSQRDYTQQGPSGLRIYRVQISCYAETYAEAKQVADQAGAALESWPGTDSVQAVFIENEIDLYEEDTELHHVVIDASVTLGG